MGGQGGGGGGGANFQQAHDVVNQCQIIAILILKSYILQNSRIELRGIVLPVPSNQSYIYYYFAPQLGAFGICDFFLFHTEIEGKMCADYGGGGKGGTKGMLPPLKLFGGRADPLAPPPPLATPMLIPRSDYKMHGNVCEGAIFTFIPRTWG